MVTDHDPWDMGYDESADKTAAYGSPASAEVLLAAMGSESGIEIDIWVNKDNKKEIKPRRGPPEVTEADFFSSLVNAEGRWIFSGVLNGWAAFTTMELVKIKSKLKGRTVRKLWDSSTSKDPPKYFKSAGSRLQFTLRLPGWSNRGYSKDNPGFCWWFAPFRPGGPAVTHGENMIRAAAQEEYSNAKVVRLHHFGHRYAKEVESSKDRISYHTGVLIEWDHGLYTTIVELAWRNGIGGYGGKSNWVEDRDSDNPVLKQCFPAQLFQPYIEDKSEIRMIDIACKNEVEFVQYLNKYTGKKGRFLDPSIKTSLEPKAEGRTRKDIAQYICNRISHNIEYSEPTTMPPRSGFNCQTFAANFFGFMTQTKEPCFSKLMKMVFTPNHKPFTTAEGV